MPINPQHNFSVTYIDHSDEKSTAKGNMGPITALTIAGFLTQFGALKAAMEDLSLGVMIQDSWTGDVTKYNSVRPADPNAQRERKWRVDYMDNVNFAIHQFEIPVAKAAGQVIAGTDFADLSTAEWVAFKTAFEAMFKSPDGNAVTLQGAHLVGRNL